VLRRWGRRAFPPLPRLDARYRWALTAVVALGAVLRIAWATQMQRPVTFRDPGAYLLLAEQAASGNGWTYAVPDGAGGFVNSPTAYYPPGYPLFLTPIVWLARLLPGDISGFGTAVAVNVVLSVVLVWLTFALGRRLAGPTVGLVAAAATAVWPNLVFHSGVILTETLFLVVLTLLFLVALATPEVARAPGWRRMVAVGVLLGAIGLIRPVSLVIAPLLVLLWWSQGVAQAVKRLAVVGAAVVLVLAPWSILSTARMDSFVLLSLNFGDNLCIGYRDGANGGFSLAPDCFNGYDQYERPEFELRRQSDNIERATTWLADHPGQALGLVPDRARYTLQHDDDGVAAAGDYGANPVAGADTVRLLGDLSDAFYWLLAAGALAGVVVLGRSGRWSDRRWQFFVLSAPVSLLSPLLTFGDPRFKMPIYPVLAICAGVAVAALVDRRSAGDGDSDGDATEPAASDGTEDGREASKEAAGATTGGG
jgi:hypothetical protein